MSVAFPNLYEESLDNELYGSATIGDYVKRSYRGGWCYLAKGKSDKIYRNGVTLDVNSLYPSMMSSMSGNKYPTGLPTFWSGNFIPKIALTPHKFFFIRIRTRFYLKKGMLPFIQIKNTLRYKMNDMLETSDIWDKATQKYYSKYKDADGNIKDTRVTLTMTMMDYNLFLKHYDVEDFEILDGCYFDARVGLFDEYIDKYKKIKMESTGAVRQLAKLFLNNLYGKMASSTDSSFKVAKIKDDGSLGFYPVRQHDKTPGYIPVGSAITSYARCFTINAAQANYHGTSKPGFIYADTDSIHCDLNIEEVKGLNIDPKEFCCWAYESKWDIGLYTRQKTYIEHITLKDEKPPEGGAYYDVKCAGMPDVCKDLFIESVTGTDMIKKQFKYKPSEWEFVRQKRSLLDFKIGLKVPGKLMPKRIRGGVVLKETTYEMR